MWAHSSLNLFLRRSIMRRCTSLAALAACSLSNAQDWQTFEKGQQLPLWEGPVGPYHSPFEQYPSTALPLCRSAKQLEPATRLGGASEILSPVLVNSNLRFEFQENVKSATICSMKLDASSAQLLAYAVSNHYWAQFFLDELPVYG